jgi:mRNA interferase RelE/StbE
VELRYSSSAAQDLRRCDKRKLVREKIEQLARDPLSLSANVIRLTGRDDYRLRVQNWRVIFTQGDGVIQIERVLPRGAAYED